MKVYVIAHRLGDTLASRGYLTYRRNQPVWVGLERAMITDDRDEAERVADDWSAYWQSKDRSDRAQVEAFDVSELEAVGNYD